MQKSILDEQHITMKCPTMQVENKVGHNQIKKKKEVVFAIFNKEIEPCSIWMMIR